MAYIGRQNLGGAYRQLDDISSGFDGSDTTHTMQVNSQNVTVGDVNQIILSLGGVIQKPGTDFTVSGSTLTFTTAPAANTSFFAILLGSDNGGTVTPTDASVTSAKLSGNLVTPGTLEVTGGITANGDIVLTDGDDIIANTSDGSDNATIAIAGGGANSDGRGGRIRLNGNEVSSVGGTVDIGAGNVSTGQITFLTGATTRMTIDADGHITKPTQPAFQAQPSGVQSNIGDSDTIEFATEIFDQNSDYNNSTFTFTAPVTGKYLISGNVRIDNLDITGSPYHSLVIVTSNRAYYNLVGSSHWDADAQYFFFSITVLADMDANDTVYLRYQENSSAADQADVSTSSYFSGHLAC